MVLLCKAFIRPLHLIAELVVFGVLFCFVFCVFFSKFAFVESGRTAIELWWRSYFLHYLLILCCTRDCFINPKILIYEMAVAKQCDEWFINWLLPGKLMRFFFIGITTMVTFFKKLFSRRSLCNFSFGNALAKKIFFIWPN